MELIPVKCPCCGGRLEIPDDSNKFFCNHCGTQIIASNADLKEITVKGVVQVKNADFDIQGGVLIGYHGESVHVVIPDGVKKIGEACFKNTMIESVKIPDSVTVIAHEAFQGCGELAKVELPHGLKKIGSYGFSGCALKSIVIPKGVSYIGTASFGGCSLLEEAMIMGENITIYSRVFKSCTCLKKLIIDKNANIVLEGHGFFSDCKSLEEIVLPDSVTQIPDRLFKSCASLKKINIPIKCHKIGYQAFLDCASLEGVIIPEGVKMIDHEAFLGCTSLEEIMIPESVTQIGNAAFANCTNLKLVEVPGSLKKFEEYIFGIHVVGMNDEVFCEPPLEEIHLKTDEHLQSWLLYLKNLKMVYCNGVLVDLSYLDKYCEKGLRSIILSESYSVYSPWRKMIITQKQDRDIMQKGRMQKRHCPKCDIPLKSVKLFDKSEMVCPKCGAKVNYPKSRN